MAELSLAIGGLRTAILTRDHAVAGLVRDRYKGFLSPGSPDWRIEVGVRPGPPATFVGGYPPFGQGAVVRRNDGTDRFLVEGQDFVGTVDLGERSAQVALDEPDELSLDSFLRIAYSLALVDAGGLLVHAASLVRKGKAYLFCGPSGSGKTTVSRLSLDAIRLSDELSIVRLGEARACCYGTPFWGELVPGSEDRSAPLVGIYFLHKAGRHAVEPVRPRQALEQLLPNVMFFAREAELTGRVLGVSADLVETVPCFDLAFRPDPGFWAVIADA